MSHGFEVAVERTARGAGFMKCCGVQKQIVGGRGKNSAMAIADLSAIPSPETKRLLGKAGLERFPAREQDHD